MRRVRIIHWRKEDAAPLVEAVRKSGFTPEYDGDWNTSELARAIRATLPDAVAVDLSRLPSHGREMAVWMRNLKTTRHIPLVFVNGEEEKLAKIRELLPDAIYTTTARIGPALKKACKTQSESVVVPAPMMQRYSGRTTAQKLGIAPASVISVMDAPRGYASTLGPLPEGAEVAEDPAAVHPVTLWFITDYDVLLAALPRMRAIAAKTKLWIAWRKGPEGGISQNTIREAGIEAGLVDYKICSLDPQWSGILFARKKS
ncbi:MAG TPA: hypothetical protein VKB79_21420 [Bryobacteraceae bacterium]|nr:hypothetical protein [Bryobacteraceae bacterium]